MLFKIKISINNNSNNNNIYIYINFYMRFIKFKIFLIHIFKFNLNEHIRIPFTKFLEGKNLSSKERWILVGLQSWLFIMQG